MPHALEIPASTMMIFLSSSLVFSSRTVDLPSTWLFDFLDIINMLALMRNFYFILFIEYLYADVNIILRDYIYISICYVKIIYKNAFSHHFASLSAIAKLLVLLYFITSFDIRWIFYIEWYLALFIFRCTIFDLHFTRFHFRSRRYSLRRFCLPHYFLCFRSAGFQHYLLHRRR